MWLSPPSWRPYGTGRGFRFWPLFIAAVFLGFPLVLLGITLAAGPDSER